MKTKKQNKICLAASAGGHLTQLLKLSLYGEGRKIFYVTSVEVVRGQMQECDKVYVVGECNRQHPLKVLQVLFRCVKVIYREHPNVIISTGAATGFLMCLLGRCFGAKIVWIDSIANIEKLSLSGCMVRYFADLFLTQWPELAKKYKKVEFVGAIV